MHDHKWKRMAEFDANGSDKFRCECGAWGFRQWSPTNPTKIRAHAAERSATYEAMLKAGRRPGDGYVAVGKPGGSPMRDLDNNYETPRERE